MFSLFLQISISEITKQNLPPHQAKNPFDNKGVASGKTNEDVPIDPTFVLLTV